MLPQPHLLDISCKKYYTISIRCKYMFGKKYFIKTLLVFMPFFVTITCGSLVIYTAVQQDLRIGANDPQIQMAEDAASALSSGQAFENVLPRDHIDISKSLAPYLIIYDNQGHIFSSSATLHGKPPQLPDGILNEAQLRG